jgi:hypothetical protein
MTNTSLIKWKQFLYPENVVSVQLIVGYQSVLVLYGVREVVLEVICPEECYLHKCKLLFTCKAPSHQNK